jgi:hypothetical protein
MKIKTSELTGPALDWAVAKAEGREIQTPPSATNEDLAKKQVPFTLYGIKRVVDVVVDWSVEEITVTRFGVDHSVGATAPSISFTDETGRKCRGSAKMFYLTREDAQRAANAENLGSLEDFEPSTDWSQGGPIIEREGISPHGNPAWSAQYSVTVRAHHGGFRGYFRHIGPTPLISAMRCFVASKLGDEVDVPEELLS